MQHDDGSLTGGEFLPHSVQTRILFPSLCFKEENSSHTFLAIISMSHRTTCTTIWFVIQRFTSFSCCRGRVLFLTYYRWLECNFDNYIDGFPKVSSIWLCYITISILPSNDECIIFSSATEQTWRHIYHLTIFVWLEKKTNIAICPQLSKSEYI